MRRWTEWASVKVFSSVQTNCHRRSLQRRGQRLAQLRFSDAGGTVENQGQGPGRFPLSRVAVQAEGSGLYGPVLPQNLLPKLFPEPPVEKGPGGERRGGRVFRLQNRGMKGRLHLPPEGDQPGAQVLIAVKAPDASGEKGGQDRAFPLVEKGRTQPSGIRQSENSQLRPCRPRMSTQRRRESRTSGPPEQNWANVTLMKQPPPVESSYSFQILGISSGEVK